MREASLCKKLRHIDVLQEVLSAAHQRSRLKYAQHQEDDELLNLMDAPDIICEWPGSPFLRGRGLRLLILEGWGRPCCVLGTALTLELSAAHAARGLLYGRCSM